LGPRLLCEEMNLTARPISQKEPATRQKTCKQCKVKFEPSKPLQIVCSPLCGVRWVLGVKAKKQAQDAKKERKENRIAKEKQKSRRDWIREVQTLYNKFIRARDADKPCISCGREEVEQTVGGKWDCGHYLSVGSHPELRFEELNAAKQCKSCNGGSGRYAKKNHTVSASYRVELINRIGIDRVEWLEGTHEPKHYSIDDLKALKYEYKLKLKALEKK
jgi:hypothetical protein